MWPIMMKKRLLQSGPAMAAALGLIAIQTGMGIVLKVAQTNDGSYSFSTSGSVCISEFCKLLLSAAFFRRECLERIANGVRPRARSSSNGFLPVSTATTTTTTPLSERMSKSDDDDDDDDYKEEEGEGAESPKPLLTRDVGEKDRLDVRTFWRYFCDELTAEKQFGFYILALAYTLINNSIFLSYYLADPGTIQLVKTSGTLMTAIIMVSALKTSISNQQWAAVFIQMFGLILTQYKPGTGTAYPGTTYAILFSQVLLSASSSVYNQHLVKMNHNSLHADNMVLYASGAAINLVCHVVLFICNPGEPAIYQGYGDVRSLLVILSNIFIGLAITAVYKHADAVIKCFAMAVATGLLLYLSTIFFGAELGSFVILGTVIVFFASGLYVAYPLRPTTSPSASPDIPTTATTTPSGHKLPRYSSVILSFLTMVTIGLVAWSSLFLDRARTSPTHGDSNFDHDENGEDDKHVNPFHNVLAMVRWNSAHPERIPQIRKYEPFFDSVHISMPDMHPELAANAFSWADDQYTGTFQIYEQVSLVLQQALARKPDIKGLLYFHFDAWIDPLAFDDVNWNNMWISAGTPDYRCMTTTEGDSWWGLQEAQSFHLASRNATHAVDRLGLDYQVNPDEWCIGWSDIYYIPRRFFADYILLAAMFKRFDVFHEIAIPTMVHILDQTERKRSKAAAAALDFINDCLGNCCDTISDPEAIMASRCGHKLDYLDSPVVEAYYEKLVAQAAALRSLPQPASNSSSA